MRELRLMIVEDDPILLSTLTRILKREILHVHPFSNPVEALKEFETINPDIVLSDIRMPEMDGFEMIRRIRKINKRIPIIISSAFSDPDSFIQAIRLKVKHFLIKPIDVEELLEELSVIEKEIHIRQNYAAQEKLLEEYKRIVDVSNLVSKADKRGIITYVNEQFCKLSGYTSEELIGKPHNIVRHPDMPASFFKQMWETISNKQIWQGKIKNRTKNGGNYYVMTTIAPIMDNDNNIVEYISVREDITELTTTLEEARRLEKEKKDYLALIDENIITSTTDLNGMILSASSAFCRISQYREEELIGQNHRIVKHPDMKEDFYIKLWKRLKQDGIWQGEIKNRAKDGTSYWVHATISPRWDEMGNKIGYTAIRQDITDKKRVEELSVTDHLTGLFNRSKLDAVLGYEIPQSRRYQTPLSVILIDIDHFKEVNDIYGHLVGDQVLQELSTILKSNGRSTDTIGRWGGEEFLIILPKTDLAGAREHAEHIRQLIESHDFPVVGHKSASFGISMLEEDDTHASLVDRSDQALYRAKTGGRNRVVG